MAWAAAQSSASPTTTGTISRSLRIMTFLVRARRTAGQRARGAATQWSQNHRCMVLHA